MTMNWLVPRRAYRWFLVVFSLLIQKARGKERTRGPLSRYTLAARITPLKNLVELFTLVERTYCDSSLACNAFLVSRELLFADDLGAGDDRWWSL